MKDCEGFTAAARSDLRAQKEKLRDSEDDVKALAAEVAEKEEELERMASDALKCEAARDDNYNDSFEEGEPSSLLCLLFSARARAMFVARDVRLCSFAIVCVCASAGAAALPFPHPHSLPFPHNSDAG